MRHVLTAIDGTAYWLAEKLTGYLTFTVKVLADMPLVKTVAAVVGGAIGYLFPTSAVQSTAVGALLFILADTVTGMWVAYRCPRSKIESRKFARLIDKMIGYCALCLITTIAAREMGLESTVPTSAALWGVMATEGVSVLENIHRLGLWDAPFLKKLFQTKLDQMREGSFESRNPFGNQTDSPQ